MKLIPLSITTTLLGEWAKACEYALGGPKKMEKTFLVSNGSDASKLRQVMDKAIGQKKKWFNIVVYSRTAAQSSGLLSSKFASNQLPDNTVVTVSVQKLKMESL